MHLSEKFALVYAWPTQSATDLNAAFALICDSYDTISSRAVPSLYGGFPIDFEKLKDMLERFQSGDISIDTVLLELNHLPYEDLGFAKLDHHRALRRGFPEVVLGLGKTPE